METKPVHLDFFILAALMLCGFALYYVPLHGAFFCLDDSVSVVHDPAIEQINIPRIFDAFNTRFLTGLSFALNYKWCGLHASGYRFVGLLFHCFNAFLVYLLVKSTLYLYQARDPIFSCRLEWPAFFASMLFLCHPIQTEPVNYITQRFVLMGALFYLLTMILYIRYRCRSQKRYLIAAMVSALAAMFCKEFTVTLPLMLTVYDVYFLQKETVRERCKSLLPFFLIALIVPVLLLRTPPETIGAANIVSVGPMHHIDITRDTGAVGRKQYFLTELNVVCTYVRLLFLPIDQNFDYDYPVSYGVDARTLLSGAFLLCLLAIAGMTYRSHRIISFGILCFFIALSVESSFIPIGHVIAEYRLYLASVGFVFLVTALLYTRRLGLKRINMIAAAVLIGFSVLTYQRNKIWKDEISLCKDEVRKSPHKLRAYNSLGSAYFEQGNYAEAISEFDKAIEINPNDAYVYYNRGLAYSDLNKFTQALSDFNKTIGMAPDFAMAYNNRGWAYYNQGKFDQAMSDYDKAIAIDPGFAMAYNNRGWAYYNRGKFDQAMSDYDKAIAIDPDFAMAYNNRGWAYYNQGKFDQAMSDYDKAIAIDPGFAMAYNNRGWAYYNRGKFVQAMSDYDKAIAIDPHFAMAHNNRAMLYEQLRKYGKARTNE